MSFQDEFANKAKNILGDDEDERILNDKFEIITIYFTSLIQKIGEVKKDDEYKHRNSSIWNFIKINDVELSFRIIEENNTVAVEVERKGERKLIDTFIVKHKTLYSEKENIEIDTDLIEKLLKETFQDLLNL